ncbi:hypothetical protein BJX99DRAFT_241872 [Aspergillus californicus]
MDSPSSAKSSPSKALNPLSPERMNQQSFSNSPSSLSKNLRQMRKPNRGHSDVQSKVAYLNTLAGGSSSLGAGAPSTSAGGAAALQRAILGREEAESALSRVSTQLTEAQSRERRISERLESLLEELQNSKERQAHERIVFEKEIRKARKEAFRAGSVLVKTQDDLKHLKSESKALKGEIQSERESKEKAKQESFERAYAIAGLTEELDELKGRLRTAEASSLALQQALEQEIQKQKIEGDLSTPSPRRPKRRATDTDVSSPAKSADLDETPTKKQRVSEPASPQSEDWFGGPASPESELDFAPYPSAKELVNWLRIELEMEQDQRQSAEAQIEFMKVQCMLDACECRLRDEREEWARADRLAAQQQKAQQELEKKEQTSREIAAQDKVEGPSEVESQGSIALEEEAEQMAQETNIQEQEVKQEVKQEVEEEVGEEVQEAERAVEKEIEEEVEDFHQEEAHRNTREEDVGEEDVVEEDPTEEVEEPLITFSPVTGTFRTIPSPKRPSPLKNLQEPVPFDLQSLTEESLNEMGAQPELTSHQPKYESHPYEEPSEAISQSEAYSRKLNSGAHRPPMTAKAQRRVETPETDALEHSNEIHNIKRIPLRAEDDDSNRFADVPGTPISREAALAQIRARRGRTSAMNRSVSANDAGLRGGSLNANPARAARRIPGVENNDSRGAGPINRRDMSAPLRLFR